MLAPPSAQAWFFAFIALGLTGRNAGGVERPVADPPRQVDERRAAAAGIRVIDGDRLRLYTDLPEQPEIDRLPEVFAQAVSQWAAYFGLPEAKVAGWKMQGYLISDREKFAALKLLPAANPDFANGYAEGRELWLVEQPSDYYRRHLLLHEGTHGFMLSLLGGCGAGWYMEGVAELLGTHRYEQGRLELGIVPASREATPMWGRTMLVHAGVQQDRAMSLRQVLAINNRGRLTTAHYAWTWTLATLLERDPRFHDRFRKLQDYVQSPEFNVRFARLMAKDWQTLDRTWQATITELDYGYDFRRMSLVERTVTDAVDAAQVEVSATRGWQSTGWLLKEGRQYRVEATGRYQVAVDPPGLGGKAWLSEPAGVTLEYHAGHPLGALLGVLAPASSSIANRGCESSFADPIFIGPQKTLQPACDAVLYLRVNDSPAALKDNRGSLAATIRVD